MQVNNGVTQNDGYYDQNGELQTDGWCQDNYFRDGRRVHGAQIIEGKYYYFLDGTGGKGGVEFSVNTPGVYWVDGNYYYYNGKGNRQKVSAKKDGFSFQMETGVMQLMENCSISQRW